MEAIGIIITATITDTCPITAGAVSTPLSCAPSCQCCYQNKIIHHTMLWPSISKTRYEDHKSILRFTDDSPALPTTSLILLLVATQAS